MTIIIKLKDRGEGIMRVFYKNKNILRGTIIIVSLTIILILLSCIVFLRSKAPKISDNLILHPTFATKIGEFSAGTFFVLKVDGYEKLLAVTALHIFGPRGGLDKQYQTSELKSLIKDVSLVDAYNQIPLKIKLTPIKIKGALVNKDHAVGDIAAFLINTEKKLPYLKFSTESVNVGDEVWLVTAVVQGASATQKTHSAKVISVSDKEIRIKYNNSKLKFSGTSGSPIVNKRGEVIGINVGSNNENDELVGYSNPAKEAKSLIENAIKLLK
jgi:hypothetical protein